VRQRRSAGRRPGKRLRPWRGDRFRATRSPEASPAAAGQPTATPIPRAPVHLSIAGDCSFASMRSRTARRQHFAASSRLHSAAFATSRRAMPGWRRRYRLLKLPSGLQLALATAGAGDSPTAHGEIGGRGPGPALAFSVRPARGPAPGRKSSTGTPKEFRAHDTRLYCASVKKCVGALGRALSFLSAYVIVLTSFLTISTTPKQTADAQREKYE